MTRFTRCFEGSLIMQISFDLDDTLICYDQSVPREPRLSWLRRLFIHDEPLRLGAARLAGELLERGHELWIYTTSFRSPRAVRRWLSAHGIPVSRVIAGTEHVRSFGPSSSPSKRPHAFGIDLHVDDSPGVAQEARQHGFQVCIVHPSAQDWVEQILAAVEDYACRVDVR